MNKHLPLTFLTIFSFLKLVAQDASFSQISNTQIYSNPSSVIMNKRIVQVEMAYHKQWMGIDNGDFNTAYASINMPFPSSGMGVGLSFMQDIEGIGNMKSQFAKLTTRYNLIHSQSKSYHQVIGAIDIGYARKSINSSNLIFTDDLNPVFGVSNTASDDVQLAANFLDLGFSFTYANESMDLSRVLNNDMIKNYRIPVTISFSAQHINQPTESLLGINTRLPAHYVATLATTFTSKRPESIHLRRVMFQWEQQAKINKYTVGAEVNLAGEDKAVNVYVGGYYANSIATDAANANTDAYVFLAGFEVGKYDRYNICLSYDYNNRGLSTQSGGTIEITFNMAAKSLFKTIVNCFAYKRF